MKYQLNPYHRNVPEQELLDDLKKVALKLGKGKVTKVEYDEHGKFSSGTFEKRFGWTKAIESIGLKINMYRNISDEELFKNIEEVWIKLGRQPLNDEIKQPLSKCSEGPYRRRFGSWRKSLAAFVEYINSDLEENPKGEEAVVEEKNSKSIQEKEIVFKHKTKRNISERLKVQVLMRDGNKCKLCGITVEGENIHFDHKTPWSKGGETVLENLQVLCGPHNLAKGNLEYKEK